MTILARFRGFHRDTGGQISFLMVVGAVALTILLGWLGTTGYQVAGKVEAQAAADAAALSGGVWIARGLNLTSAINVIQSQLVAGAIVLNSFYRALKISQPVVKWQCRIYSKCPWPPCILPALVTCAQYAALGKVIPVVGKLVKALSTCPKGFFWKVAKGLELLNAAIHRSFFAIAFVETYRMARANDASVALLLPGRMFAGRFDGGLLTLPTKEYEFPALCDPMERGSPSIRERGYAPLLHYAPNQGPLRLGKCRISNVLTLLTGLPPVGPFVLPAIVDGWKARLCGGGPAGPIEYTQRRPAESLAECAREGGKAEWLELEIVTEWLDRPLQDPQAWLRDRMPRVEIDPDISEASDLSPQHAEAGDLSSRLESDPNIATVRREERAESPCDELPRSSSDRRDADRHGMYFESIKRQTSTEEEPRHRYSFRVRILVETEVEVEVQEEFAGDCDGSGSAEAARPECSAGTDSCRKKLPRPYLLRDGSPLPYLVLAARENRRIWFTEAWRETPPPFITYAQVEVYNGVGLSGEGDAFTQDWRVRLQRATLLDSLWTDVSLDGSLTRLEEVFSELMELLRKLPIQDGRLTETLDILEWTFGAGGAETAPYLPEDGPVEGEAPTGEPAWRAILNH